MRFGPDTDLVYHPYKQGHGPNDSVRLFPVLVNLERHCERQRNLFTRKQVIPRVSLLDIPRRQHIGEGGLELDYGKKMDLRRPAPLFTRFLLV